MKPVPVAPTDENQAADLAALAANAQTDAPAGDPGSEQKNQEQNAPVNLAQEFQLVFGILKGIFGEVFPSIKKIYTEQNISAAAGSLAEVCNKHGVFQDGFGPWKEELACAVVVLPLAWATHQGIKGDIANMQQKKQEKEKCEIEQTQDQQVSSGD